MIIQAGAARRSISTAPLQAKNAANAGGHGRQAMDELRLSWAYYALRPWTAASSPAALVGDVRELVEGDPTLPIELTESGTPPTDVPSSVACRCTGWCKKH